MSFNRVVIVGRLGKDPESRQAGGTTVTNFSVATDETYKDKSGEKQKKTEWHKIAVWGRQAEIAQQYLTKGMLVLVEGKLETREWEDKSGGKRSVTEIRCDNFRMLERKQDKPSLADEFRSAGVLPAIDHSDSIPF